MAKVTSVKPSVQIKTTKKKKSVFPFKAIFIFLFLIGIIYSAYHYRSAMLHFFNFNSNRCYNDDKVANAHIIDLLSTHKDLTFGIDISRYQGEINWRKVNLYNKKFPLQFVFINATAGSEKKDARFDKNWKLAKQNNFICGAYHYYRPNENSIDQANNFINSVNLQKGDLPPVLDIENVSENQSIENLKVGLKRWLSIVRRHYKVPPIIYTSEKFYNDYLKQDFKGYNFWIANYNFNIKYIKEDWLFWQFSKKARIEGIKENVDINIYNGTPKMLQYLTISN